MPNIQQMIRLDPTLNPYAGQLRRRAAYLEQALARLLPGGGSLGEFANAHLYYGFQQEEGQWVFREWAPAADAIALVGDFNGWNPESHPLRPLGSGGWELCAPGRLPHGAKVRLLVQSGGETLPRIPAYIRRAVQSPDTLAFDGQIWQPQQPYRWGDGGFRPAGGPPLVYEAHVGLAGEQPRVATFEEFTQNVLPRVRALGYNTLQLMAVMEHPYYGSFGYQVSSFYAVSSRFGTPEDLKRLIDTAHQMGIAVLLDVVHSHAASNEVEGLSRFDGTPYQYFHAGQRGRHPAWGTRLFNYGKPEVLHFLLSNLKFWLEEYHFDGFRFDGVTSMLYRSHGLGENFTHYSQYFGPNVDDDAVAYLQMAATLCAQVKPHALLVAEDMSGMPGMCLPVAQGGLGFGYRLAMGMPDYWTAMLGQRRIEDWDMRRLWAELTRRRRGEKTIGYCECHDQSIVGGQTIMFRLAGTEMYDKMEAASQSLVIDNAVAFHKLIRLVTCLCAGEGYLNFMGNEFGHPEWIDMPREGNGYSYQYARRQWGLADNKALRYQYLQAFDKAMLRLVREHDLLGRPARLLALEEDANLLVFTLGDFLCAFNLHPTRACAFAVPGPAPGGRFVKMLDTNADDFGAQEPENSPLQAGPGGLRGTLRKHSAALWRLPKKTFM